MDPSLRIGGASDRPVLASRASVVGSLLLAVVGGCGFVPGHAPMRYSLSDSTAESLSSEPLVRDQIGGALEMFFGTPQNPGFLRTSEWVDDDFDPNHPDAAADDGGSGEFSESELEEIHADNRRRFARQLAQVEAGNSEGLERFRSAPDLSRRVSALILDADLSEAERKVGLKSLLEEYYPSLRDSSELYRQECLHCHGVEGGGDGPTSGPFERPFLDPRPRDYRLGIFKFTAVKDKARPRRQDLFHVLDQGVYGTAMPSFRRFSVAERWGLVDYVRLLAIRGEVERRLVVEYLDAESLTAEIQIEVYKEIWEKWGEAKSKVVAFEGEVPEPTEAMLSRGKELFHDAQKGNCASCHGDRGLGDGASAWKIDDDGKKVPAYLDDWGQPILPRDLVRGMYRGGSRPIDIYRRIYAGINGGPMPALGESKDAEGNPLLSSDDMWSLVHYVRSMSIRDEAIAAGPGMKHSSVMEPGHPTGSHAGGSGGQ
jgi:mono/diheme cytochrome c family protein